MPRDVRLYLDDILEAIARIEAYVQGLDQDGFSSDTRTQDAVVRNLEVIGEASRNLPEEATGAAPEIEWRKIVGLRNLLSHEYFVVSVPILWDVVSHKLTPLRDACRKLLATTAAWMR
jgi:uncharacterized protein with HEPN domain